MARSGFYIDNSYRSYPFVPRSTPLIENWPEEIADEHLTALPYDAVVDAGIIMHPDAEYYPGVHQIYLFRIARTATGFTYEFRTTAPAASQQALVFQRNNTDPEFTLSWASSAAIGSGGSSSLSDTITGRLGATRSRPRTMRLAAEPRVTPIVPTLAPAPTSYWEGYLVTGKFDALMAQIPVDTAVLFNPQLWLLEPAQVQGLTRSAVTSLNLANAPRVRSLLPECSGESLQVAVFVVNAVGITGDVALQEGYNCLIRQDDAANALAVGASLGAGDGFPCTEFPLYEDEELPSDSVYYEGGPACSEVIKTINGVGGRQIRIEPGAGFDVTALDANTLQIALNLNEFAVCADMYDNTEWVDISLGPED
jgi:hypothetical protein